MRLRHLRLRRKSPPRSADEPLRRITEPFEILTLCDLSHSAAALFCATLAPVCAPPYQVL